MPAIRAFNGIIPALGNRVYIDPACTVIGDVHIGDDSSVWPGTVIRGDVNHIRIGARSNIQDGTIIHVSHDGPDGRPVGYPTLIGDDVTIGHGAIVHACTIGNACLIGMGATILAGAVIPPGKTVRRGELWLGNPAKCVRTLSEKDIAQLYYSAQHYVRLKDKYLAEA